MSQQKKRLTPHGRGLISQLTFGDLETTIDFYWADNPLEVDVCVERFIRMRGHLEGREPDDINKIVDHARDLLEKTPRNAESAETLIRDLRSFLSQRGLLKFEARVRLLTAAP